MSNKQESSSWPHENDLVFRRDAIEAIIRETNQDGAYGYGDTKSLVNVLDALPSAQPEPSIPLSWIDEEIERLKGLDNAFATLTAMQISGMVKKWSDEQDG